MGNTDELCQEKHKNLDGIVEKHELRLDTHDEKIDKLEIHTSSNSYQIESLCTKIGDLVSTCKWFIGLGFTTLVGFAIWAVQSNLAK